MMMNYNQENHINMDNLVEGRKSIKIGEKRRRWL